MYIGVGYLRSKYLKFQLILKSILKSRLLYSSCSEQISVGILGRADL